MRAIGGCQSDQLPAAGYQHRAAGAAGQQGTYLVRVPRVVQHNKHAFARQQAAV